MLANGRWDLIRCLKGCIKNQQLHQLFIQFINYVWQLLHVSALHCHLQGAFLVPCERCSIEEQSIEYCGWVCCVFVGFSCIPLNAELNPICHLLALQGSATIIVVVRLRVNCVDSFSFSGAEPSLITEKFGLLNDLSPSPSILDADDPIFDLQLTDILFDILSA